MHSLVLFAVLHAVVSMPPIRVFQPYPDVKMSTWILAVVASGQRVRERPVRAVREIRSHTDEGSGKASVFRT